MFVSDTSTLRIIRENAFRMLRLGKLDTLRVQVLNTAGAVLATLHTYSNLGVGSGYLQRSFSLAPYLGRTVILKFTGTQTLAGHNTSFLIDDTALNAS